MTYIFGSVESLQNQIKEIQNKIADIQEACTHPTEAVEETPGASTGNYDQVNSYWTDRTCHLCQKKWRIDLGNGQ